jgi:Xaa-Pro aminopeptidase
VHEPPRVSFLSDGEVLEGMVVTIEPGIYIPDWGGVRIEDTVVVTKKGCEMITEMNKALTVLDS